MSNFRWLWSWSESLRDSSAEWLLVHKEGEYHYRSPLSGYVHRWETFSSREDALDWLDRCIAKVEQDEWNLYHLASREAGEP